MAQLTGKSGYNSTQARFKSKAFKVRHQFEVQSETNLDNMVLPEEWADAKYVYQSR